MDLVYLAKPRRLDSWKGTLKVFSHHRAVTPLKTASLLEDSPSKSGVLKAAAVAAV